MTKSLAIVLTTLVAVLLPLTPAHAAYGPPQTVNIEVRGWNGNKLSLLYGTIQFDDGNQKFQYDLYICRENSYAFPNVWRRINNTINVPIYYTSGPHTIPQCVYSAYRAVGEVTHPSTIQNVTLGIEAVGVGPDGYTFVRYQKEKTYDNPFN